MRTTIQDTVHGPGSLRGVAEGDEANGGRKTGDRVEMLTCGKEEKGIQEARERDRLWMKRRVWTNACFRSTPPHSAWTLLDTARKYSPHGHDLYLRDWFWGPFLVRWRAVPLPHDHGMTEIRDTARTDRVTVTSANADAKGTS